MTEERNIERFHVYCGPFGDPEMCPDPDGEMVRFSDYSALQQRVRDLEAAITSHKKRTEWRKSAEEITDADRDLWAALGGAGEGK